MARAGWKSFALVQHNLVVAGVATVNPGAIVTVSASLHDFRFQAAIALNFSMSYLGCGLEVWTLGGQNSAGRVTTSAVGREAAVPANMRLRR